MSSAVFCDDCGIRNNPSHMNCKMCAGKLPLVSRQNPLYAKLTQDRAKAAVFDLDLTLLDNSQRFRDAIRAGLVDKKGKPKVKGMMSKKQAWNKRNKFIYSKKEMAKDVVIPGATQLVSDLKNDGYTIIYLTARPNKYHEQTIQQLESKGFPLFRDRDGEALVFSKPPDRTQTPAFKANKVRELLGKYKVEMVFDDDKKNLEEIAKLGIPGLYASLSDHVKHNPGHSEFAYVAEVGPKGPYVTSDIREPDIDKAFEALPEPDGDEENRPTTVGDTALLEEERMKQMSLEDFIPNPMGPNPLPNPLPQPKKKKLSNGKYRKEPKKIYVNRMMETKKMEADYPDRKQRYAVTMTLVEKFYGKAAARPKTNPANPSKVEKAKKLYKHMNGKEPAKIEKKKVDLGDVWYQVGEGGCWQIGYISGKDNGKDNQRYTHVFNEETKDGNYPKLYATMPENGSKPMLIITGGTWKIRTDATGTAWIYD
jgi:hypothetical protein